MAGTSPLVFKVLKVHLVPLEAHQPRVLEEHPIHVAPTISQKNSKQSKETKMLT
jgi:hypothetical protein